MKDDPRPAPPPADPRTPRPPRLDFDLNDFSAPQPQPAECEPQRPPPLQPELRAEGAPTPAPTPAPRPRRSPARPRRAHKPGWWVLGAAVLAGLLYLSWAQVPVRQVVVSGNTHLAADEVRRLAGLPAGESPFGWLYYGRWKAKGLLTSPWIASAEVTRQFPDTVRIQVNERQPLARWRRTGQPELLLAEDGTALPIRPGVTAGNLAMLPVISGWGPERLSEALRLTRALSRYTVQSVTYTPSGLSAQTASGTAWGGDLETFVKYAGSIGMYPNKQIHIYPWGVSVQE
ncbi:cell division protein FtsQ/DivIB [Deinococcus radiodurans]|uniref:Cell division protein FtsQ-related protein n=3 Tax=Deinococcus radiodurans TaxID=1299 RepID=Q9RWN7_DEIRA|nr:cell division protein FtsQ/DivIB [Deinococcus radiodurans]AAF10209.1 cell division protein FtsQ-related protein [Deinococcus radiodurans R1 = ATCC 13939 = DSM 20539]ANC72133.1 cell division protein FtsQ [Deinococcus radiodurans R1 = ATCC 13939 = DSM 20539]QEM72573.1 cell division protein FtsQ/DivIB [Deinococcus radiodurans]QIP28794.1 cell division protein FtsQ/DivIB [Deinococcus radiodurans]UDK99807.1 cell division protein FtsQ/DivIB [Deinococcus radiodurans R1 = ATCC 13939 = DSM 20539]